MTEFPPFPKTELGAESFKLSYVNVLSLDENKLWRLQAEFSFPNSLKKLNLWSNSIRSLTPTNFEVGSSNSNHSNDPGYPLKDIGLDSNCLTFDVVRGIFKSLPNLLELDMSNNSFTGTFTVSQVIPESVVDLTLNYNQITEFFLDLDSGSVPNNQSYSLETLGMVSNNLSVLSPLQFPPRSGFKNFRIVAVQENGIKEVEPLTFFHLLDLEWVNLLGNQLTRIHPASFALTYLTQEVRTWRKRQVQMRVQKRRNSTDLHVYPIDPKKNVRPEFTLGWNPLDCEDPSLKWLKERIRMNDSTSFPLLFQSGSINSNFNLNLAGGRNITSTDSGEGGMMNRTMKIEYPVFTRTSQAWFFPWKGKRYIPESCEVISGKLPPSWAFQYYPPCSGNDW